MMPAQVTTRNARHRQRGSTLFIVAGSLTVLLGIGALAIDIASLYVARSESQRAADAAALAGAKVFVESGCVTSGDCSAEEATASGRATQVALQNLVEGQAVTVNAVTFLETPQNPQITVQVQSAGLNAYFAGVMGVTGGHTVGATATAEAYNPSGHPAGPQFCTACVRPWLIPNCTSRGNCLLTTSGSIENPGLIGQTLQIAIGTNTNSRQLFGAVDDGTGLVGYEKSIVTCNTGQMTCGSMVNTLAGSALTITSYTGPSVATLLHLSSGSAGLGAGQDRIDTSFSPPQIHAGARNPLVVQGVIAEDAVVTTSDSIVTTYLYDSNSLGPLDPSVSQPVPVLGFAQIFITQVDASGDVWGVILGVAGCSSRDTDCDPGAIKGTSMLPIRLITPAGG